MKDIHTEEVFKVRCYSWKELGLLYSPELTPESAAKRLKRWIKKHRTLQNELLEKGWNPSERVIPPYLVRIITDALGEP